MVNQIRDPHPVARRSEPPALSNSCTSDERVNRRPFSVGQTCEERGEICWITRKGYPTCKPLPDGWLTVTQAMALPEPDTSWMDTPMLHTRFTDWL